MPSRRAVLMMRQAISPRLAIRMRLNMRRAWLPRWSVPALGPSLGASPPEGQSAGRAPLAHSLMGTGIPPIKVGAGLRAYALMEEEPAVRPAPIGGDPVQDLEICPVVSARRRPPAGGSGGQSNR